MSDPARYHTSQITLHWLVVGLVAFQFLTGNRMAMAFENGLPSNANGGAAIVHGLLGSTILLVMIIRVATRLRHGAPPPPETEPDTVQKISRANHAAFYVVLIGMPLAGLLAILTGSGVIATLHAWTSKLLLLLIAAHVAGAVWHLTKRDDVVSRMVPPR